MKSALQTTTTSEQTLRKDISKLTSENGKRNTQKIAVKKKGRK
jgi:hypothetical protein